MTPIGRSPVVRRAERGVSRTPVARSTRLAAIAEGPEGVAKASVPPSSKRVTVVPVRMSTPAIMAAWRNLAA